METKEPLRLPAFEKVIGFAVQKALEDWRDEALEGEHLHQAAWSDVSTCRCKFAVRAACSGIKERQQNVHKGHVFLAFQQPATQ